MNLQYRSLYLIISIVAFCAGDLNADDSPPNIVLLFIDDWAWNRTPVAMDSELANSRMPALEMPNIERLAREGMKFRNAYASPQCSPSRVCIQTGQSSPRNGYTVYMNSRGQEYYDTSRQYKHFPVIPCVSDRTIDSDAVTISEALKPLGYVSAHVGKWHMRGDPGDEGYVLHDGSTDNKPGNTLASFAKPGDGFLNRNLYFHYPHYRSSMPHSAVVSGDLKLLHFYDSPTTPMLFDLSADMSEVNNIAEQHSERHKEMYTQMMDYFEAVGARIPKDNPDYDASVYEADQDYGKRQMWGAFDGMRPLEHDEK